MSMNKDQVKGRAKAVEGKVQEVVGRIVGNDRQQAKGIVKKNLGKLQATLGDVKQDLENSQNGG